MLRLALETSTRLGSLAVGVGDKLVAEYSLSVQETHSETVLPEVDRLLHRTGLGIETLEAVVVGAGPGSFTGVRIATALAKGLCFARDLPLFAYSSLAAVAAGSGVERTCALFDARRGEVYAAAYGTEELPRPIWGPSVLSVEHLLRELGASEWVFAGEGALRYAAPIEAAGGRVLPAHLGIPRASALLWLMNLAPAAGRVEDPALWEPAYVRASGAERQGRVPAAAR
jgi:tRNA threonylcarbamoyladenosine biosynthesis protein TsaB